MQLDNAAINALEKRYRAALINSVTGFKPANVVGTADSEGNSNLAIISSVFHLGSQPPLIGMIIRPSPVERHTLDNVLDTGSYTINHVASSFIEAAHQTAARYPRQQSEFVATGLTELYVDGVHAPFVAEANIRLGMALREHHPLAINGTHMVIGEIQWLDIPDACVAEDGSIDLAAAETVALSGLDSYHSTKRVARMAYAKPDLPPTKLDQ